MNLKSFYLRGNNKITNEGIRYPNMSYDQRIIEDDVRNLHSLNPHGSHKLTDEGIRFLERLELRNVRLTEEGIRHLQKY